MNMDSDLLIFLRKLNHSSTIWRIWTWHKRFKSPCPAFIDFALTFGKLKSWGTVVKVMYADTDAQ